MEDTPEDVEGLRQALADARAEAAAARAIASSTEAVIAALKLEILKLRRELYGQRSERRVRLLEQMGLQLEELEPTATEDELAAKQAAARTSMAVRAFERRRPRRKPHFALRSARSEGAVR
jgi:transposase